MTVTPEEVREFMYGIINRSFNLGLDVACVHTNDARIALPASVSVIKARYADLERYELGGLHDGHSVWINKPCSEFDWCDIKAFCDTEGISIREIIVDRKLEHLD